MNDVTVGVELTLKGWLPLLLSGVEALSLSFASKWRLVPVWVETHENVLLVAEVTTNEFTIGVEQLLGGHIRKLYVYEGVPPEAYAVMLTVCPSS